MSGLQKKKQREVGREVSVKANCSSEIKMATTGCPKSSNVMGWMPVLLLPHKTAVACKDWEASSGLCGQLQRKPISNTSPPRLSLRLPLAAAYRARQDHSFLLCFLNMDHVSQCTENIYKTNGENTELWQDSSLVRVHRSNFPLLSHTSFSLKDKPKFSPGHLWYTQS